jgi:hypothetical protein
MSLIHAHLARHLAAAVVSTCAQAKRAPWAARKAVKLGQPGLGSRIG